MFELPKYRRILITGANGLLGQALVELLSHQPIYDVLATSRDQTAKLRHQSCGYIPMDILETEEMRHIFIDFAPDVVVHCAAMTMVDACETQRDMCWQLNVGAVEQLVRLCRAFGTRLVHLSTDFIFDGENGPYSEKARPNPLSYYGRTKLAAENAVRTLKNDQWALVRTILVYGTGHKLIRPNIATWLIEQLDAGKNVRLVTDQWRTPTYVHDLAEGIERLIRFRKAGVWNIAGREMISIFDFGQTIAQTLGFDPNLIEPTNSNAFTQPAKRPLKSGLLILKAESEIGYKPKPIPHNIQDLIKRDAVLRTETDGA
ncbi:MAG: dTDP-4-dehydrorhamnose reductase [Bacteroidetes Order II. Incertae sedis bacterium]|nr:dTDP-4-dehydrorhamnose reductase [Bacteroidetes Order II. bacterium]